MTLAVIITLESEILRLVITANVVAELLLEPVKLSGGRNLMGMTQVISASWIIWMHKTWFSVKRASFSGFARFSVESGSSVGTIRWFALESGPQNGSSFLLETGEWVNRVTSLNSVMS